MCTNCLPYLFMPVLAITSCGYCKSVFYEEKKFKSAESHVCDADHDVAFQGLNERAVMQCNIM